MSSIVWMDLEMTGLVPEKERIIELAVLITDAELNVIAEGPDLVIHQSDEILAAMDEWNTKHHGESGLVEKVRASTLTEAEAEAQVMAFLKEHTKEREIPLAGSSIHQDRRFLALYMKEVDAWLHYRMIDVSSIKELAERWYPGSFIKRPTKKATHRAVDDIRESIAELQYYRETIFREKENQKA